MNRSSRLVQTVLLSLIGVFVCIFVIFPAVNGISQTMIVDGTFSIARYAGMVSHENRSTVEALANSALLSFFTVVFSGLAGSILAVALSQPGMPQRGILSVLAILPMAMPPLVGTVAFLFVFGEGGIVPRVLGFLFGGGRSLLYLDGFGAILAVHTFAFNAYFFLFVASALRSLDASVLDAAAVLGASRVRTFTTIILPHLRPALLGASSLVFMASMASFSAPLIYGGSTPFLTTLIYSTKLNGDMDLAAAQSVLLMSTSLLFFMMLTFSTGLWKGGRKKGVARIGYVGLSRRGERSLMTVSVLIVVLELLPALAIVLLSFVEEGSWTWQLLPERFTLQNYYRLVSDPAVFEPVRNSTVMSFLAVFLCVCVGGGLAFLLSKGLLRRFRKVLDLIFSLPFAVPGTVVGIYLILAFNVPRLVTGGAVLLGTFWILPLAYVFRSYPVILRSVSSSLEQVDDTIMEAASTFGGSVLYNIRRVLVPLILPGIVSGALLVGINALGEFPSSILLFTHANRPIAVEILSQLRGYNIGSASAYSVFLLVVVLLLTQASASIGKRRKGTGLDF